MKPSEALITHRDTIRRIVESHRACNPRVFGSLVHGDDTEHSDLDILIDSTAQTTLFDIGPSAMNCFSSSACRLMC